MFSLSGLPLLFEMTMPGTAAEPAAGTAAGIAPEPAAGAAAEPAAGTADEPPAAAGPPPAELSSVGDWEDTGSLAGSVATGADFDMLGFPKRTRPS